MATLQQQQKKIFGRSFCLTRNLLKIWLIKYMDATNCQRILMQFFKVAYALVF